MAVCRLPNEKCVARDDSCLGKEKNSWCGLQKSPCKLTMYRYYKNNNRNKSNNFFCHDFCSQNLPDPLMKPSMKSNRLVPILVLASAIAQAAPSAPNAPNDGGSTSQTAQAAFPKNLARQHLGTNLRIYNADNQTYTPT